MKDEKEEIKPAPLGESSEEQKRVTSIKYGSVEYFTLENLHDRLSAYQYDKLDLIHLDKLRFEVELKIKSIQQNYKPTKNETI